MADQRSRREQLGLTGEIWIIVRDYSLPQGGVSHVNEDDGYFTSEFNATSRAVQICLKLGVPVDTYHAVKLLRRG